MQLSCPSSRVFGEEQSGLENHGFLIINLLITIIVIICNNKHLSRIYSESDPIINISYVVVYLISTIFLRGSQSTNKQYLYIYIHMCIYTHDACYIFIHRCIKYRNVIGKQVSL